MALFGFQGLGKSRGKAGNAPSTVPAPPSKGTFDAPQLYVPGLGVVMTGDSGMVSNAPMARRGPRPFAAIRRLLNKWLKVQDIPDPAKTTEMGSAGSASPSTYQQSLYTLRYERRAVIADCRLMYHEDSRCYRAVTKYAREATRKGVNITFSEDALKKAGKDAESLASEIARDVAALVNPKLESWGAMTLVEGELFVQAVYQGDRLVNAKRMPAVSIERLSDDTDEFQNPEKAFEQIDVQTDSHVAFFPLGLMYHLRWNHIDGERYGWPEIATGRRQRRNLELLEEAQKIRRMTRASQRTLWKLGNAESTVTKEQIKEFRETNGMVEGQTEALDPANIALNYFGNHLVSTEKIGGDEAMSDIADIEYAQNIYANAALPTPAAIYGLESKNVNRDVLEDQRGEWLKETAVLSDALSEVVTWLVELALLLRGRLPETLPFTVSFAESSIESASDVTDRVIRLRTNTIGAGAAAEPDPLISKKTALRLLATTLGIDDVDRELADIESEVKERRAAKRKNAEEDAALFKRIGPQGQPAANPAAPSAPGSGFQGGRQSPPNGPQANGGNARYVTREDLANLTNGSGNGHRNGTGKEAAGAGR